MPGRKLNQSRSPAHYSSYEYDDFPEDGYASARAGSVSRRLERLRAYDPNFSGIAFTDFVYALYARVHEARGRGDAASTAVLRAARGRGSARRPDCLRVP